MHFPEQVYLVEVMPRDGLQSLPKQISTEDKIDLINQLSETGLKKIEVASFAHPKVIPQLSDAEEVLKRIKRKKGVIYRALAPNVKGCLRAIEANTDEILAVISCSEQYSLKNQNKTIQENLKEIEEIICLSRQHQIPLTIALTNSFYCPFEGGIAAPKVIGILQELVHLGGEAFYIATTMGKANPKEVYELLVDIFKLFPGLDVGLHLHNNNGMALANIVAGMQAGVSTFEGSMLGIGGGIVTKSGIASGNVPLEDVINMFHSMGIKTGVDLGKYLEVVTIAERIVGQRSLSYFANIANS